MLKNKRLAIVENSHPNLVLLRARSAIWKKTLDEMILARARGDLKTPKIYEDWLEESYADQLQLEPNVLHQSSKVAQPKFSVVVPFRDREHTLEWTVKALANQTIDCDRFELILVDDASRSSALGLANQWLANSRCEWSYLRLPAKTHLPFRAGLARNWGAHHARGDFLVFIDSDIVVPPTYLDRLAKYLSQTDLVQSRRWQVWRDRWQRPTVDITDILKTPFEEANLYWVDFNCHPRPWMTRAQPWKYVSSNCLALKRERFMALGGFRLWYSEYGFEDTDLGYRAFKDGATLGLSDLNVMHLNHMTRQQSERAMVLRPDLMRRSARKFVLINQPIEALDWLGAMVL